MGSSIAHIGQPLLSVLFFCGYKKPSSTDVDIYIYTLLIYLHGRGLEANHDTIVALASIHGAGETGTFCTSNGT